MNKLLIGIVCFLIVGCAPIADMYVSDMDEFETVWKGHAKVVTVDTINRDSQNRILRVKYRVK